MGLFERFAGKEATTAEQDETEDSYRGVEIIIGSAACCEAVKAIANERFLSDDVPMLPLRDCDAADCRCSYQRFSDRRTEARRASDTAFDIASQLRQEENRRDSKTDRRDDEEFEF